MTTFQEPRFGDFGQPTAPQQPRRTSIAAIMSLVLGILALVVCCLPGVSPVLGGLGLVFAILAFMFIGSAQGRLGGRGIAVGGMVCSIVGILFGVMVLIGVTSFVNSLGQYGKFVEIAQSEDQSGMTALLSPGTAQTITPEEIAAFKTATLDAVGKYQKTAPGMLAFTKGVMKLGQMGNQIPPQYVGKPGQSSMIPVPAAFEKGGAMLLVILDPKGKGATTPYGSIDNIAVVPDGGTAIWLIDPAAGSPGPMSFPAPAPTPATVPPATAPDTP